MLCVSVARKNALVLCDPSNAQPGYSYRRATYFQLHPIRTQSSLTDQIWSSRGQGVEWVLESAPVAMDTVNISSSALVSVNLWTSPV